MKMIIIIILGLCMVIPLVLAFDSQTMNVDVGDVQGYGQLGDNQTGLIASVWKNITTVTPSVETPSAPSYGGKGIEEPTFDFIRKNEILYFYAYTGTDSKKRRLEINVTKEGFRDYEFNIVGTKDCHLYLDTIYNDGDVGTFSNFIECAFPFKGSKEGYIEVTDGETTYYREFVIESAEKPSVKEWFMSVGIIIISSIVIISSVTYLLIIMGFKTRRKKNAK